MLRVVQGHPGGFLCSAKVEFHTELLILLHSSELLSHCNHDSQLSSEVVKSDTVKQHEVNSLNYFNELEFSLVIG